MIVREDASLSPRGSALRNPEQARELPDAGYSPLSAAMVAPSPA
jgi:hypothetical protein